MLLFLSIPNWFPCRRLPAVLYVSVNIPCDEPAGRGARGNEQRYTDRRKRDQTRKTRASLPLPNTHNSPTLLTCLALSPSSTYTTQSNIAAGCVAAGAVFAEGSAMASADECSYCFCIRGSRRCVAPKCLLPVSGCKPRYRTFSCCPSDYDCREYGVGSSLGQTVALDYTADT